MAKEFFGTPLKALAQQWMDGKAATRKAIAAHVRESAARKNDTRWTNAAVDMEAGDTLRVKARATGSKEDWAKAKAANPKIAKPKASKPKAEPKAKAAPATKGGNAEVAALAKRMDSYDARMDAVEAKLNRVADGLEVLIGLNQKAA